MYDRSTMQRPVAYTYPQFTPSPQSSKAQSTAHHTSSAFSASANPNEDWTKISDLAERRRIQNRIAQRNYRKKLKKRLEDLERRAGSSSASPEQKHEELPETASDHEPSPRAHRRSSASSQGGQDCTPENLAQQYTLPAEDRGMFAEQSTRQLSTSPPPFSFGSLATVNSSSYVTAPLEAPYCGMDMPLYPQYIQPVQQHFVPVVPSMSTAPIKPELYSNDDEMNPFSMSYATMAGVDVSAPQHFHDVAAHTPPLSDSFDLCRADSPLESLDHPSTPQWIAHTPPTQCYGLLYYD